MSLLVSGPVFAEDTREKEMSGMPEMSSGSEMPGMPEMGSEPEMPGMPDMGSEPEMPGMPDVTSEPEAFGMSDGPGNHGKKWMGMGGKASMVATNEGGVIVLAGNKLTKYDAELNVIKEVEIKMPMGCTMCPMKRSLGEDEASEAETPKKVS